MREDIRGFNIDMAVGSDLDYGFDWSAKGWLSPGETIVTSAWATDDASITLHDDVVIDDTIAVVYATGGTLNAVARITNTITTSAGRVDKRSINLHVKNR